MAFMKFMWIIFVKLGAFTKSDMALGTHLFNSLSIHPSIHLSEIYVHLISQRLYTWLFSNSTYIFFTTRRAAVHSLMAEFKFLEFKKENVNFELRCAQPIFPRLFTCFFWNLTHIFFITRRGAVPNLMTLNLNF